MKKAEYTNIKTYKTVILSLSILMLGSLFYIYKLSDRSKNTIVLLRSQKATILSDLKNTELKLTTAINEKSVLSKQLIVENTKVKKLIQELENSNVSEILNIKFQKNAQVLQNRISFLIKESAIYKRRADSTALALVSSENTNKTLSNKNKELQNNNKNLNEKIDEATALSYFDIKTTPYKVKSSGKQIETANAGRVDLLRISFMIAENKLAKPKSKKYYIQIIDSKNNVLGEKQSVNFGEKTLVYSTATEVKYDKKTMKVETDLSVSDLTKGFQYINIFDGPDVILSTVLALN